MAKKDKTPVTAAIRALRASDADYAPHLYKYVERGGTSASSAALGVAEHAVIKTLVMQDDQGRGLVVLMHGDREVATGVLARQLGVKKVSPCDPRAAQKLSGYQVGGTSPFGLKTAMPVYAEIGIADLEQLYINGGKRGFLVSMKPEELERILEPTWIEASTERG